LNEMGGTVFRDVLLDLAKSTKNKDLEKVLDLLPMMSAWSAPQN
jgi:hypothetical protein